MVSKECLEEIEYYSKHHWNEKTAKDMFEELGYEQEIKNNAIYYFKKIHIPKEDIIYAINFILKDKEIFNNKNLTVSELKAINKQVEELGWEE